MNSIARLHERWLDEDEDAQVDIVTVEKTGGLLELLQCHSLVQLFQGFRICGFQADGDFQASAEQIAKFKAAVVYECGMAFDNDAVEVLDAIDNGCVVLRRDSAGIKEASTVVEFDDASGVELPERVIDLSWDGSGWN